MHILKNLENIYGKRLLLLRVNRWFFTFNLLLTLLVFFYFYVFFEFFSFSYRLWLVLVLFFSFSGYFFSARLKKRVNPRAVAAFLEREGDFNFDLYSATSLTEDNRYSSYLKERYISATNEKLLSYSPTFLKDKTKLKKNLCFLIFVALSFVSIHLYSLSFERKKELDEILDIKNIDITITPPSYTLLGNKKFVNSNGDISCLKGSLVKLKFEASISTGTLLLNYIGRYFNLESKGSQFQVEFPVLENGTYGFSLEKHGKKTSFLNKYKVTLHEDKFPEAEIIFPEDKLVLKLDNKLEIEAAASDDFGLGKILFKVNNNGEEIAESNLDFERGGTSAKVTIPLNLADYDLKEGDNLSYFIRVYDNDSISGPKYTDSRELGIEIFSEKKLHEENLTVLKEIIDRLVVILADLLTSSPKYNPVSNVSDFISHQNQILKLEEEFFKFFSEKEKGFLEDDLMLKANLDIFEQLSVKFSRILNKKESLLNEKFFNLTFYTAFSVEEIEVFETGIIKLENLIRVEKILNMKEITEELDELKKEIKELLAKYKENPSEELLEQIKKKIAQARELMQKINENLAELSSDIAEEFFNKDAMKALSEDDPLKMLDKNKNMEDSLYAVENFLNNLSTYLDSMNNPMENMSGENSEKLSKEMGEMVENLEEIKKEEEVIYKEVSGIGNERKNEKSEEIQRRVKELSDKIYEMLSSVIRENSYKSSVTPEIKTELRNNLNISRNIKLSVMAERYDEGHSNALNLKNNLSNLSFELRTLEESYKKEKTKKEDILKVKKGSTVVDNLNNELVALLEKLLKTQTFSEKEKENMQKMAKKQDELLKKQMSAKEKMDKFFENNPMLKGMGGESLEEAGEHMKSSSENLKKHDKNNSMLAEENAIKNLKEGLDSLNKMRQKMAQDQYSKKAGSFKTTKEIKIPKREEDRSSEDLNKMITEAMKERYPEKYRNLIKKYYRSLLK